MQCQLIVWLVPCAEEKAVEEEASPAAEPVAPAVAEVRAAAENPKNESALYC